MRVPDCGGESTKTLSQQGGSFFFCGGCAERASRLTFNLRLGSVINGAAHRLYGMISGSFQVAGSNRKTPRK